MPANPVGGEGFDAAKPWTEAMQFPGAWDYGWLKQLLEDHGVTALLPDDRVANVIKGVRHVKTPDGGDTLEPTISPNTEIRMASTPDDTLSLVYAPFNTCVQLKGDWTGARITVVDLATRRTAHPAVRYGDGITRIEMCPFAEDILIVAQL